MLRFVPIDTQLVELAADPVALEAVIGARLGAVAPIVADVLVQTAAHQGPARPAEWGAFLAIDEAMQHAVGTCAFVNAPDDNGRVEIAYFTFPPFEGRGVASAMASELVRLAERGGGVRSLYAHTLPETNASARILIRLGFTRT